MFDPMTIDQLAAAAKTAATRLLTLPDNERAAELAQWKHKNEVLHALLVQQLKVLENQVAQKGDPLVKPSDIGRLFGREVQRMYEEHKEDPKPPEPVRPEKQGIAYTKRLGVGTDWNILEALEYVRLWQPKAMAAGYYLALAGGVLNNGSSQHDLDIVAMPRTSASDPALLMKTLTDQSNPWWTNSIQPTLSGGMPQCELWLFVTQRLYKNDPQTARNDELGEKIVEFMVVEQGEGVPA